MSKEILKRFVEQAIADEEFRRALMVDPSSVLAEWGFSAEEIDHLETLIEQGIQFEELDERISKYLFGGGGPG